NQGEECLERGRHDVRSMNNRDSVRVRHGFCTPPQASRASILRPRCAPFWGAGKVELASRNRVNGRHSKIRALAPLSTRMMQIQLPELFDPPVNTSARQKVRQASHSDPERKYELAYLSNA